MKRKPVYFEHEGQTYRRDGPDDWWLLEGDSWDETEDPWVPAHPARRYERLYQEWLARRNVLIRAWDWIRAALRGGKAGPSRQ